MLLLYTDGLVETRTDDLDTRIDSLSSAFAGLHPDVTPDQVCDALLAAMSQPGQDDDIALARRIDLPAAS